MEKVTFGLRHAKSLKLLEELEELEIIKFYKTEEKIPSTDKAPKYRGAMSKESADA